MYLNACLNEMHYRQNQPKLSYSAACINCTRLMDPSLIHSRPQCFSPHMMLFSVLGSPLKTDVLGAAEMPQ